MTNKYSLKIVNVLTTADLLQRVTIQDFNEHSWGRFDVENNYNGRVGYIKDNKMQGRVTIFSSGKMISTGANSVLTSIEQLEISSMLLVKSNFVNRVELDPKVRNVVANMDLKRKIDLNLLANSTKSILEPDQFPGLTYRIPNGPTFLIFASGKMIIAGAKSEKELIVNAENMCRTMETFYV